MRRLLLGLLVMIAIVGCGANAPAASSPASPVLTAAPSPTPSSVAATTAPSEAPTSPPTEAPTSPPTEAPVTPCRADQLTGAVMRWEGAAGHQIASVALTTSPSVTCEIEGTPQLQLVDAIGLIVIDSVEKGDAGLPHVDAGAPAFLLAPGEAVQTQVSVSNYCGNPAPTLPTTIAMVLPSDGGRIVLDPGPGGDVPACMSSPGDAGSIEMNGWVR